MCAGRIRQFCLAWQTPLDQAGVVFDLGPLLMQFGQSEVVVFGLRGRLQCHPKQDGMVQRGQSFVGSTEVRGEPTEHIRVRGPRVGQLELNCRYGFASS